MIKIHSAKTTIPISFESNAKLLKDEIFPCLKTRHPLPSFWQDRSLVWLGIN